MSKINYKQRMEKNSCKNAIKTLVTEFAGTKYCVVQTKIVILAHKAGRNGNENFNAEDFLADILDYTLVWVFHSPDTYEKCIDLANKAYLMGDAFSVYEQRYHNEEA